MSQDDFLDWLYEDGGDRHVQRKLEAELQNAYSYQARESDALRSQVERATGSLEQRLDRLTKAFYAFVELTDVRAELAVFEDEATVRHAAQRMLRSLLRRSMDPSAELAAVPAGLPGCPGYWLRPAVVSVGASVGTAVGTAAAGGDGAAATALAEAQQLDPVRTAVFRAASLALAGQAALAAPLLSVALQPPGEQVTYAQRALWRACAHGVYGDAGATLIRDWLSGHVRGLDAEPASAERGRWGSEAYRVFKVADLPGQLHRGLPPALARHDALTSPLVAARELTALASWVRAALTGEPADPAATTGTAAPTASAGSTITEPAGISPTGTSPSGTGTTGAGSTSAGTTSTGTTSTGSTGTGGGSAGATAADSSVTALGAVAAALTEEGSRDEVALARRARELREIIDDRKAATRPSWDAPEDSTLSLLRADAFGQDLPLRRLALVAAADWVIRLADGLAKSAAVPPPDQLEINVDGHPVQLSASGQASLRAAYAEIEQENAPQNMSDKLFGKKHAAEETAREQGSLSSAANQAAAAFAARVTELRAAAKQAAADSETITAALTQPHPIA